VNQKELKKSVLDYDIVLRLHISSKIFSIILPSEAFAFALYLYFIFLTSEFCFEYFFCHQSAYTSLLSSWSSFL